ncbi:MAG: MoxR family ATPase [Nitrospirae bacterium]|jgi:MoxR-like ATPase|nr:MoxR family ATPase [Nitrospirota bacterium]
MGNDLLYKLQSQIEIVIKGKSNVIKKAFITLLSKGHLLIEDIPGVGKTTLAYTIAKSINCSFQRIQFTSDLLPTDIIGVNIYNQETREFEFRKGPIFSNIVLADEINRTNPKTQSALLEAMNERRVSIERKTYLLPEPFMVIATQNPIEYHGTFPLPESQLDRFMMHIKIGYPDEEYEKQILLQPSPIEIADKIKPIITSADIIRMQNEIDNVTVEESLLDYIMSIITETRKDDRIRLGVSPRGGQFLLRSSKASAYFDGRNYVLPGDIKELAPLVFGHRIILKTKSYISDAEKVIEDILDKIPVPL